MDISLLLVAAILLTPHSIAFILPDNGSRRFSRFSSYQQQKNILCISNTKDEEEQLSSNLKDLASQIDNRINRIDNSTTNRSRPKYQLGVGKNMPVSSDNDVVVNRGSSIEDTNDIDMQLDSMFSHQSDVPETAASYWNFLEPASKPPQPSTRYSMGEEKNNPISTSNNKSTTTRTTRLLPKGDEMSAKLTKAVWDEEHFKLDSPAADFLPKEDILDDDIEEMKAIIPPSMQQPVESVITDYRDIDLSVPQSVYSLGSSSNSSQPPIDLVWDLMRKEAYIEASREPLLVSFLYSTILNHPTLESALSFHLANRLSSQSILSTQMMSLIREALDADPDFRRNLRADILAVRDRDPACNFLPDVFLYFKGFHALQAYRVSHYLWKSERRVLASYMQSQVSQHFQIDIHPNATLGSGIMLDHGTGIVIGETAHVGHNCSILHHVTLGGSGKKGVDRHPKIGSGVLLGAGSSVLGNIKIGDGCQVGAGTLVIEDLPERSVAVGVPANIIGKFVDVTAQPSIGMNQLGSKEADEDIELFSMDGI